MVKPNTWGFSLYLGYAEGITNKYLQARRIITAQRQFKLFKQDEVLSKKIAKILTKI